MTTARLIAEVSAARTKAEAIAVVTTRANQTYLRNLSPATRERLEEQVADLIAEKPE